MLAKSSLNYPTTPEFEQLLNSCGSMTSQLEALGHELKVNLLGEEDNDNYFYRYSELCLDQIPLVIAGSWCKKQDTFFHELLTKANTTPLGKFLFARDNQVMREPNMQINLILSTQIEPLSLQAYLPQVASSDLHLWQRRSIFWNKHQQLHLVEIMLPALSAFF